MEIVDNAIMLLIPGAMDAGLDNIGFYAALAFALLVAGTVALPRQPPADQPRQGARGGAPASPLESSGSALPPGDPRRPRLRLVPDRRRGRRRRRRRRPEARHRGVPRARPLPRRADRARARDPHARRPRLRPRPARGRDRRRRSTSTPPPSPTTRTSRSTTAGSSSSARCACARCTRPATGPSTRRSCCSTRRAATTRPGPCCPATACSSATSPAPTWRSTRRRARAACSARCTSGCCRCRPRSSCGPATSAARCAAARAWTSRSRRRSGSSARTTLYCAIEAEDEFVRDARSRRSARSRRTSAASSTSTAARCSRTASRRTRSPRARSSAAAPTARCSSTSAPSCSSTRPTSPAPSASPRCAPASARSWPGSPTPSRTSLFVGRDDADGRHAAALAAAVGVTRVAGYLHGGMTAWREEKGPVASTPRMTVDELHEQREATSRSSTCASARSGTPATSPAPSTCPYHDLHELPDGIDPEAAARRDLRVRPARRRSAASLAQRLGATDVRHVVDGGVGAWGRAGWPLERPVIRAATRRRRAGADRDLQRGDRGPRGDVRDAPARAGRGRRPGSRRGCRSSSPRTRTARSPASRG